MAETAWHVDRLAAAVASDEPRHATLVRVTHWLTTACFFALLLSGLEIVVSHPRFYWGESGNVLTPALPSLPIPASRATVPTVGAAARIATTQSLAREFSRAHISNPPFANELAPPSEQFTRLAAGGFRDWRLPVDGLVARPASLTLDDVKRFPVRPQITEITCEEGWSYIAEWAGAALSDVLRGVGLAPQARYVVYFSIDGGWWDSIDTADALHPQTLLAYAMNDGNLPVAFGGPLRIRVSRQLGYKSVKFINRLTVTDSLQGFGKGLGSAAPEAGYAWYAGI